MLTGSKILCGVTGGIAAYKAAELVSTLTKQGCDVHVVMTRSAAAFVAPLTFRTLTGNPVHSDMFAEPKHWQVEHIGLAEQTDLAVVAPATANILAKMALGLADDFLSTVLLALTCPLFVAPAMNHAMYHHPATQSNLEILRQRSVNFIGPAHGRQACGSTGDGRMSEPREIVAALEAYGQQRQRWRGKKVLVTAGGTREPIDPVRYIGNHSSGKMGHAIAQAFQESGADVTLVTTASLNTPPAVERLQVTTAAEMYEAVLARFPQADVVVKAAAVADYRPEIAAGQKIKKQEDSLTLRLVPTPDILAELGRRKERQILVGFAAETENVLAYAQAKLARKNADLLVLNDVTQAGAGFGKDTNIVSFLKPDGSCLDLPLMSKRDVAWKLVAMVEEIMIQTEME